MTADMLLATPTGTVRVFEQDGAIVSIHWVEGPPSAEPPTALLAEAARQLTEYFAGVRRDFDLPVAVSGTKLDEAVWSQMRRIPYGRTLTYGDIAHAVGAPARAVGTACGRNPAPIVVPCHRVLGAGGKLVGFSGGNGIETKRALLVHEGALLA